MTRARRLQRTAVALLVLPVTACASTDLTGTGPRSASTVTVEVERTATAPVATAPTGSAPGSTASTLQPEETTSEAAPGPEETPAESSGPCRQLSLDEVESILGTSFTQSFVEEDVRNVCSYRSRDGIHHVDFALGPVPEEAQDLDSYMESLAQKMRGGYDWLDLPGVDRAGMIIWKRGTIHTVFARRGDVLYELDHDAQGRYVEPDLTKRLISAALS